MKISKLNTMAYLTKVPCYQTLWCRINGWRQNH